MGRPKRSAQAAAEEALTPPDELAGNQSIVRVVRAEGNNLYTCELPNRKDMVLELAQRFRNTIWIKRGGYVLAERYDEPEGRVQGEIINVVRDEKAWRKQSYWCVLFVSFSVSRTRFANMYTSQAQGVCQEQIRRRGRGERFKRRKDAAVRLGRRLLNFRNGKRHKKRL